MRGPKGDEPVERAEAGSRADGLRVLLANEPRAYRECIATVFGHLRPDFDVKVVGPDALDDQVRSLSPDVAICSRATGIVEALVPVWVELYPGYAAHSIVSERGMRTEFEEIRLDDLLSIADRAAEKEGGPLRRLAQNG